MQNSRMLQGAEMHGVGQLSRPEDFAYDSDSRVIYTGCLDGWIKRVAVNESSSDVVVENLVNTGGRPLGLGRVHNNAVIVADADKIFNLQMNKPNIALMYWCLHLEFGRK
ncbi:hypothetical protein U1Q18_002722 [Sarracenia purpurea var. burkii]